LVAKGATAGVPAEQANIRQCVRHHFARPDIRQRISSGRENVVSFRRAIILTQMASVLQIATPEAIHRIRRVQVLTIAWMTVEAVVSLFASWKARSPALLAFGGDSAIELFSALVVLWSFRGGTHPDVERKTARIAGALLFALAAYVAVNSAVSLQGYTEPRPTLAGIAILVAALAVMPWFAKEKRRLSAATGSAALRADATQSALCAYLSLIALIGLAVNAIWHMPWADPVAALLIIPLVLRESWQAIRGRPCDCC